MSLAFRKYDFASVFFTAGPVYFSFCQKKDIHICLISELIMDIMEVLIQLLWDKKQALLSSTSSQDANNYKKISAYTCFF
jgi:hypothetical protein